MNFSILENMNVHLIGNQISMYGDIENQSDEAIFTLGRGKMRHFKYSDNCIHNALMYEYKGIRIFLRT